MMNVECNQETLEKLNYNFRFNDAILRNLIISKLEAITSPSIMMADVEEKQEKVTEKK
jgi:small subunit ribosomal protein S6